MATISDELRKMAKLAKANADALDEAFLKRADPRAVQGGAIDEVASDWRTLADKLKQLAGEAQEVEELT